MNKNFNYEKVGNKLYVIPENMSCDKESYNYKILKEENIKYLNKIIGATDKFYIYEQNGMSLKEWLKGRELKCKDIVNIVLSIKNMLSEAEDYLLPENNIILDLDTINIYNNNYKYVMLPNCVGDLSFELSKFMIRILRYCDVEDKDCLSLAYTLFVVSSKPYFTIDDLVDRCEKYKEEEVR